MKPSFMFWTFVIVSLVIGAEKQAAAQDEVPMFDLTDAGPVQAEAEQEPAKVETVERKTPETAEVAPAAAEQPEQTKNPRTFALGVSVMSEHALGALARLRFNHVAIDLAYGVEPMFFSYGETDPETGEEETKFEFDMALVNADGGIAVFFSDDQKKFQNGLRAQGIFNNIMGPGAGLGWAGDLCWKRFALEFGAGVQYYFKYEDWVKDHFDYGSEVKLSALSALNIYFGVNLIWYLT